MRDDTRARVKEIQASMVESANPWFVAAELDDLRCLIRVTFEFMDYLQTTSAALPSDFDRRYAIETIFSAIDSYANVSAGYRGLADATSSSINWGDVSMTTFNGQFTSKFHEFVAESNFEKRCRLLLDLFKLQIIFSGFSYD
jgi:hypothetical protein